MSKRRRTRQAPFYPTIGHWRAWWLRHYLDEVDGLGPADLRAGIADADRGLADDDAPNYRRYRLEEKRRAYALALETIEATVWGAA